MITKTQIQELIEHKSAFCISIFMETNIRGEETLNTKDAIHLKNVIKSIKKTLEEEGQNERQINSLIEPIQEMISDQLFWRNQSAGLVIFASDTYFKYYKTPWTLPTREYVSNEFYVRPLLDHTFETRSFYFLSLALNEVRLFEANQYDFLELDLDDYIPKSLEESVGSDYVQSSIQNRSQPDSSKGLFHGHFDASQEHKSELLRHFRNIHKGIEKKLGDNISKPLVLCCLKEYYPIYFQAANGKMLYDQFVQGNPTGIDIAKLHKQAWQVLKDLFNQPKEQLRNKFLQYRDTERTSTDLATIFDATLAGKTEALFIQLDEDAFGNYNPNNRNLSLEAAHKPSNVSLYNVLSKLVWQHGGKIFETVKADLADQDYPLNAVFRY